MFHPGGSSRSEGDVSFLPTSSSKHTPTGKAFEQWPETVNARQIAV